MSKVPPPALHPFSGAEQRLIRLHRLAGGEERCASLQALLTPLLARYSLELFWPGQSESERAAWLAEEATMDPQERLMRTWPLDWPEKLFDLDDLGDPGAVLEVGFSEIMEDLFGECDDEAFIDAFEELYREHAGAMFSSYYETMKDAWIEAGNGSMSAEEAAEEFRQAFRRSVASFLNAWRDEVVRRLERRSELPGASRRGEEAG